MDHQAPANVLSTPMYGMSHNQTFDPFFGQSGFDDVLMGNFLHDIVNTNDSVSHLFGTNASAFPDVLHFGSDDLADFPSSAFDRTYLTSAPIQGSRPSEGGDLPLSLSTDPQTPAVRRAVHAGEQAFRESMWLWDPSMEDNTISEQANLGLSTDHSVLQHRFRELDPRFRLSQRSRDRLLSMVLRTCESGVQRQVVSCFPSVEFLSFILADFRARHIRQISPWIHFDTINLENECEEFLAALICAGAAESRQPDIRRLGSALQEAVRVAILKRLEDDNRQLRDLRSTQALVLILIVGLNSASRRKIEIAETLTLSAVTTLRRGERFRNRSDTRSGIDTVQQSEPLDARWMKWIQEESFKRLVYHVLFQDAQVSSALFRQPIVSYTEINLVLPCPQDMWNANNAETWWQATLRSQSASDPTPPTLPQALHDPALISLRRDKIDVQMSLRVLVSIFWLRVWQSIQLRAASSLDMYGASPPSSDQFFQQLVSHGQSLSLRFSEGSDEMHASIRMILELGLMHLHVSLEDIQLLAGKEGEDQARKAASRLRSWISLPESRKALFHAGQVAKEAARCPLDFFRGYHAVVVYHASLTMWAYALLSNSQSERQSPQLGTVLEYNGLTTLVQLDENETPEIKRFILLGSATAAIKRYKDKDDICDVDVPQIVPLTNASDVMMSMAALLATRDESEHYCIPLVNYLTRLMRSLAKASTAMKLLR
ncbi:hypothetical protein PV10_05366 [Exophiala mesophila]|uniref:Xylanolytic transcriptional activator regulatory domain-containing protein n=1 Tax=Exophiala mesophila TaxID=212818 RepID=A0A0D1WNV0_EXOME|nr:uncharacterized protein PV10_05366 [Exophiala mesophila]KIV90740.1 hypothetical protein PV10_05366 [Exophiala mesophila]